MDMVKYCFLNCYNIWGDSGNFINCQCEGLIVAFRVLYFKDMKGGFFFCLKANKCRGPPFINLFKDKLIGGMK